ncbi:hypothetical protein ACQEU5_23585 [Marinactinospora thermotolerans]|uniref:Uncharacterized protein n=1 Tax=Marinactinospora thermotolerans DSM 45154 TaxID=1122192 RepID=A0A1T4K608_9ACTN|nr:hypothetical protein [Marinactinospora thermotolerans]SJZ37745.1 hypothetical protein SAMN02745673_00181 [Marinactinospora thermotolerans DSM 45154]
MPAFEPLPFPGQGPAQTPSDAEPLIEVLAALARRQSEAFRGHNAVVGGSRVVHAVEEVSWIGGATMPAPACHVGVHGGDPTRLRPTRAEVTCRRCRARRQARRAGGGSAPRVVDPAQLSLDLD